MICFGQCNMCGSDVLLSDGIFNCYVRDCDDYGSIGGNEASTSPCPWEGDA